VSQNSSLHENYRDEEPTEAGSDRVFGCTVGSILMLIGATKAFVAGAISSVACLIFASGTLLLLLGIVAPSRLSPLNRVWLKVGTVIAKVVNPVILALLFFSGHPDGFFYANSWQTAIGSRSRSNCSHLLDRARAAGGRGIDYEAAVLRGIRMGSFIVEFWYFLRVRKKFWLAPIMITMALFGALLIASQGSAIAPFIYTLF
jgi:hypothetical protein